MLAQTDVRTLSAPSAWRRHPAFFPVMSVLLIVCVFVGFAPTYYRRPAAAGPIPPYLHVHGAAMTLWFLMLFVQTALIATRRRAVHRRLGVAAAIVALVIAALNPLVILWSVERLLAIGPIEQVALIVVADLLVMGIFTVLAGLAIRWRRYPETHSRMLLLASIAVSGPALGRFSLHLTGSPIPGVLALALFPLMVVAHDRVLMRRVHPVSAWGTAAIVASLAISVAVSNSPAGPALVRWLQ
jgi:hypothetical protein